MIQQSKPRFFTPFDFVRHQQLPPLWLLVNRIGLILAARLMWMLWQAPLIRGWILFQDGAGKTLCYLQAKPG
ncbi:MAG: hypothetical protein R2911_40420 [Caldilineaceae bacterium]